MCWHYTYHHFTLCDHVHPIPTHGPYYLPPQHCQRVTDALNWYHTQPERLPELFPVLMPSPCPMEPPQWDWMNGCWDMKNCRTVGVWGLCMFCAVGRGWGGMHGIRVMERGGYGESYTDENGEGRVRWHPLEETAEDLGEEGNRMMAELRRKCARMGISDETTTSTSATQGDPRSGVQETSTNPTGRVQIVSTSFGQTSGSGSPDSSGIAGGTGGAGFGVVKAGAKEQERVRNKSL